MRVSEASIKQERSVPLLAIKVGRWYLVLCAFLLFAFSAFSQPKNIIKEYGVTEGLSLGNVTSIAQDVRGLMWIATEDGLNRFDGYTFNTFKYDPDDKHSLTGNFIQKVFIDSRGNIWVSSRHGLNRFDASSEKFTHFQNVPGESYSIVGDDITDIAESASGNLWVASYNAGFSYFNRQKGAFVRYGKHNLPGLSSNKIISLFEDHAGLLWVGTQDAGINIFRVRNGIVSEKVTNPPQLKPLSSSNIKCIYEDHLHNMWIGTSHGLVLLKRDPPVASVFAVQFFSLGSNIVLSVLEDSKEMLWVGVQDGGAYQLDLRHFYSQNPEAVSFKKVKGRGEAPLTRRSVQALLEDRDHNIWLGTYGDGVKMVSKQQEKFTNLRLHPGQNDDIRYYGICTDSDGHLWLGTDGNGIYKCDAKGTILQHYTSNERSHGLTDDAILYAFQDAEQRLWFGSYSQGLFLYRRETDSFINFKHDPNDVHSLGGNDVRVIFEDFKGNLWIGSNGGGLSRLGKKTTSFQNFNTSNSSIASNDVRAIAEDKMGRLWVGTYGGGLYSLSPDRQSFVKHHYKPKGKAFLSSDVVLALYLDRKQNLWIGTEEDGLIRYHTLRKNAIAIAKKMDWPVIPFMPFYQTCKAISG